ncbi:MAG TPA: bifunctional 3'-5' exonuclease/DNA polymerase [Streptosporangiaceae bacterium]|nr:bifunctional 3'-5' exonuclease/DNA polymerase [Streptosporangiaceae bacterium]
MRVAVVPGPGQSGLLRELSDDGIPTGPAVAVADLVAAVREHERDGQPRWVWPSAALVYQRLLRSGVTVARCHDVALADELIRSRDAAVGPGMARARQEPPGGEEAGTAEAGTAEAGLAAAGTAEAGLAAAGLDQARAVLRHAQADGRQQAEQPALFAAEEVGAAERADPRQVLDAVVDVHADQLRAIAADEHPDRVGLLATAESAGGLVAAEMETAGLPWRRDVHDALLTEMLGPRPMPGQRPARLAGLAAQVAAAFGRPVNPDSPAQLLQALAAEGIRLPSTRLAVLRDVDHPAIVPLLEYKELTRLYSAFGWSWLDTWVRKGRFRPEYVVGGVVSGRWASRGGGALQIPKMLRRAVVADPGWVLVVADAAQLEPRVLAALAADRAFAAAAMGGDLYAELATAFGGDRAKAKVAMLSAMYGGAGGEAGQLLAVLRQRFPAAAGYVEAAARAGEEGRVVRSVLGRPCPPPSANWRALTEEAIDPDAERDPRAGQAARARGRFTRNFVVQASAADWALVMLVSLRAELAAIERGRLTGDGAPELVFFQHDEVIVHCPQDRADDAVTAVGRAGAVASRLVFGPTRVAFPLSTAVVDCYADAK